MLIISILHHFLLTFYSRFSYPLIIYLELWRWPWTSWCKWSKKVFLFYYIKLLFIDPWSSDSDLSDLSPVEDEYAKVDKSRSREPPDLGDVTAPVADEPKTVATVAPVTMVATVTTATQPVAPVVPPTTAPPPTPAVTATVSSAQTTHASQASHTTHAPHTVHNVPPTSASLPETQWVLIKFYLIFRK